MFPNKKYPQYGIFVERFCKELEEIEVKYEISVIHFHKNKLAKFLSYSTFYAKTFILCMFKKYDAVYVHYLSHSSAPVLFAKRIKKNMKIIANAHGSDVFPNTKKQEKMQKYTKETLRESAFVVVPSEYFKKSIEKKYSFKNNIYVYPSAGIDPNIFKPIYKKEIKDCITLAFAGRIEKSKGIYILLEAINKLKTEKNIHFTIAGDGSESKRMDNFILEKSLSEKITRLPMQTPAKLNKLYNDSDVIIFSSISKSESLGLVCLEAMATKTPVIANDFAAQSYYVKDGINGYKYNSSEELVEAILKFKNLSKNERKVLGDNAYKTAEKYFKENIRPVLKDIMEKVNE